MTDSATRSKSAVLAANEAFYTAFRDGDYGVMQTLWSHTHEVTVYHPGWPGIAGRDEVMESWYRILAVGTPPNVHALGPNVIVNGKTAMVTCTEDLGEMRIVATNTFVEEAGVWKMIGHQAQHMPDG